MKIEDPTTFFRQKVSDVIYTFTGNRRETDVNEDLVVLQLEKRLKCYLNDIRDRILKRKAVESDMTMKLRTKNKKKSKKDDKSVKKKQKSASFTLKDLYYELEDSTESYGVQRCILLKKVGRSLTKEEIDPEDTIAVVDEDETIDVLQEQLDKLNDNSRLYSRYERERLIAMKLADVLTNSMSLDEYMEYNKTANAKFIQKRELFDKWMQWNKMGDNFYIAFSWLCVNKIKKMTKYALDKRRLDISSLFIPSWTEVDKNTPLDEKYVRFTNSTIHDEEFTHLRCTQEMENFYTIDSIFSHKNTLVKNKSWKVHRLD